MPNAQTGNVWTLDQPAASIPLGGQLGGRPYVGPPTEPSRTIPRPPLTDPVAIAYADYSNALTAAFDDLRAACHVAWQEYTRTMQDANAAYEVAARRAGLALDQQVSRYNRGQ